MNFCVLSWLMLCILALSSLFSCNALHRPAFSWSFSCLSCPILENKSTKVSSSSIQVVSQLRTWTPPNFTGFADRLTIVNTECVRILELCPIKRITITSKYQCVSVKLTFGLPTLSRALHTVLGWWSVLGLYVYVLTGKISSRYDWLSKMITVVNLWSGLQPNITYANGVMGKK